MFGYVKIYKPELKIRQFELYRSIYCSVCKKLGKRYGHLVRFSLSYDFAFLAMLGLSIKSDKICIKKSHCVYNPLKKCCYNESNDEVLELTCAASVIMMYYKLSDDIRDKRGINRLFKKLFRFSMRRKYNKAKKLYPEISLIVSELDTNQTEVEIDSCDTDKASHPTADALGKICRLFSDDEITDRILYRIGYCVGKWVYLTDALDDLEDDIKNSCYNPLKGSDIENATVNLNVCSTEAGTSFELLGENDYSDILKNIFYLGMPAEVKRIINKKETNH